MNYVTQMLALQQELNDTTNGTGWEAGMTKNGKRIDWRRAIYLECAELIESYPWKHWKNIDASPDYDNIKIEVVDIWHFIMSWMLQEYRRHDRGSLSDLAGAIEALPNYEAFVHPPANRQVESHYDEIERVERIVEVLFCRESPEALMQAFIDVALQSGLDLTTLYRLYVGKNILNRFRQ
jgi:hypothetical protein